MEEEFMYAFANAAATSFGDFTAPGMDEPWRWFAEVTPGTGRLVVEVFDPDISGNHDFRIGLVDTDTVWRVIDPNGVTQATLTVTNGICAGCDNTFVQLANIVDPATGHWAIELDQTSAVTTGNDINTFLMRVHDGNALAGGTEINVYAEHQQDFSIIVDANVDHQYHPYITGHCQFSGNDFSLDQNTTGDAEFTYTSSTGFTTSYNTVSNTNTWLGHTITGFTSDQDATGYGIFNVTGELTAPPGGGLQFNFGQYYLSDQLHAANVTPSAQPEANAWRLYWPTDPAVAGGVGNAPLKPSLEQLARYSSLGLFDRRHAFKRHACSAHRKRFKQRHANGLCRRDRKQRTSSGHLRHQRTLSVANARCATGIRADLENESLQKQRQNADRISNRR